MANNRLLFEVVAEGKNLKVVQRDADSVAKSVERTNKARDEGLKSGNKYHKQEKGIYQTGLSSAKGFSKMQQAIGSGSSGLVGAYATLAANVFAATAAFSALRSAAQVEQLAEGLEFVGVEGGRNLKAIAEGLREITGLAISSEEAMRSVALGTSAGFSTSQMEDLTKVARGASLALGRDMNDAMSRLVRGAAKLEPEILDELGIMVRLDDATQKYASTIGVSVDSLSQYERRMAFVNAINEQGIKNFGNLSAAVDPNAYDILSASLQDLYKNFVNLLNVGLAPVAEFIAGSVPAMLGGVALFGSTISRQLAPSLFNAAQGAAAAAKGVQEMAASKLRDLKITKQFPKGYKAFNDSVIAGTASLEEMEEKQKKLTRSLATHQRHVDKYEGKIPTGPDDKERTGISNEQDLLKKKALIQEMTTAQTALNESMDGGAKAQIKNAEAAGYSKAQFGTLREGWADITEAQRLQREETKKNTKTQSKARQNLAMLGTGFTNVGKRAKFMGTAFLNAIPAIGMIVTVLGLAWEAVNKYMLKTSAFDEALGKMGETSEHVAKVFDELAEKQLLLGDGVEFTAAKWKAYAGAVQESVDAIISLGRARREEASQEQRELIGQITLVKKRIRNNEEALAKGITASQRAEIVASGYRGTAEEFFRLQIKLGNQRLNQQLKELDLLKQGADHLGVAGSRDRQDYSSAIRERGEDLKQAGQIGQFEFIQFGQVADQVMAGTINYFSEAESQLTRIASSTQNASNGIATMTDKQSKLTEEINKFGQKGKGPFDDIIEVLDSMNLSFEATQQRVFDTVRAMSESGASTADMAAVYKEQQAEFNAVLSQTFKLKQKEYSNDKKGFLQYRQDITEAAKLLRRNADEVKKLETERKTLTDSAKTMPNMLERQLKLEEAIRLKKIEGLQTTLETTQKILRVQKEEGDVEERIAAIRVQILALEIEKVGFEISGLKVAEAKEKINLRIFQSQKAIADAQIATWKATDKAAEAELKLQALKRSSAQGQDLSAGETFVLQVKSAMTAKNVAILQNTLKRKQQEIDHNILEIEWKLLRAQTNERLAREKKAAEDLAASDNPADKERGKALLESLKIEQDNTNSFFDNMLGLVEQKRGALEVLANQELKLALAVNKSSYAEAGAEFKKAVISSMTGGSTLADVNKAYWNSIRRPDEETMAKMRKDAVDQAREAAGTRFDMGEGVGVWQSREAAVNFAGQEAGTEFDTQTAPPEFDFGEKLQMAQAQMQPLADMMKKLGPEGEFVAALQEGMFSSVAAVTEFTDVLDSNAGKMEKVSSGLALASQMTAQIANIMAASSQMKIAAIDKEIEQTKKLYGGTKKGEQMIAALEKKKEAQKKKSFETNKKMMMAQAVMGTAMAILNVWSDKGNGPTWVRGILAGMVAAIGAAQLAVISSMSYQGGGGSAPNAGPSKVSIGSRSNKVDVAGSRPGGELAYMRGERGMGGSASDFSRRGAFTGRYHRATGGAAYVVGEQGPELFVPEVPGQIVANDEIGEGGTPANVTFNIQTIDATNMEETLISQRGNIINMIREAANNQGETFLEGLDTMALGDNY